MMLSSGRRLWQELVASGAFTAIQWNEENRIHRAAAQQRMA